MNAKMKMYNPMSGFDWLNDAEKKMIFSDNAKKLFKLDVKEG